MLSFLNNKLCRLSARISSGASVKIAILGFGSVGGYLLDYLNSWPEKNVEIHICSRDVDSKTAEVNLIKVANLIRNNCTKKIVLHSLDLNEIDQIVAILTSIKPDFIINCSRVYSGLKYGSISWNRIRAYGLWAPLSVKYIRNIMIGYNKSACDAIVINTSYSDVVNPWLKSAGISVPDFGSGNLNHLIPRIKMAVADLICADDSEKVDVIMATSHFHDVVISKEGHVENLPPLISVSYDSKQLELDMDEVYKRCAIPIPTDFKRNMMNASSNFEIIRKIVCAMKNCSSEIIHSPGVAGLIGGYPVQIDFCKDRCGSECIKIVDEFFSFNAMEEHNRASIALDGILNVESGSLFYTKSLVEKVQSSFGVTIPSEVRIEDIEVTADFLIDRIIKPTIGKTN